MASVVVGRFGFIFLALVVVLSLWSLGRFALMLPQRLAPLLLGVAGAAV